MPEIQNHTKMPTVFSQHHHHYNHLPEICLRYGRAHSYLPVISPAQLM